jgi:hydroxymethylbilane synthase
LGLEIRSNDEDTARILESVADPTATVEVTAERSCLAALEGGCQVPIGALARLSGTKLRLVACVCSLDGTTVLRTECEGHASEAINLGRLAAERLLDQGASELIAATR